MVFNCKELHNVSTKTQIEFDGDMIQVDVCFDFVGGKVYINNIMYDEKDIKSLVNTITEQALEYKLKLMIQR